MTTPNYARASLIVATASLIPYGLFASLYWPFTAISEDVFSDAYSKLYVGNLIALLIVTAIWALLVAGGAVWLGARSTALRGQGRTSTAFAQVLLLTGAGAVTLVGPTTFASVALYNVVNWDAAYPDNATPVVLWGGALLMICAGAIGVIDALRTRREVNTIH
ncbi:hypothetical protein [Pseudoclavibacter sp. AY1H1]|uniref:hypothetical protein n=1 Tax=Pseudoclavibacter sp. AY1H1 TaxID=2080584 RepID=UPI000CE92476|nr:hypothetical protein [Pseudoclavibacter sp. AY1H1]PPF32608.1 hypothetical protein C5E05_19075 [Pseudoclavibacter sp. AY1H1]